MNWRKSSFSSDMGGECVETASGTGLVMVRDTTDRDGVILVIGVAAWSKFIKSL